MRNYIVRRLLLIPVVMLGVSLLTFWAFQLITGSAAEIKCGLECTPVTIAAIKHDLGLDRPAFLMSLDRDAPWLHFNEDSQYGDWLSGVAQGDLGKSFFTTVPVSEEMQRRLPKTVELMVLALIMALIFGIPPGILSAVRPGTPLDWIARFSSVIWLSIPSFYLGLLVLTFGASWFGWSPPHFGAQGIVGFFEDPWTNIQTFFFPALILALGIAAVIMRLTRSSMLEVMRNDYIRTAWSKGLRERSVVWRHAVKNAMIPVVTIIGLQIGALIGGAVIIESVFAINGVGLYLLEGILRRDLLVVQSLVLLFAVTYVVINLIVDVAYAWLDPRIRYG